MRKSFRALLAVLSLGAALPARAGHEIEPGLWQLTEIALKDGKSGRPDVKTDCVPPEEARDPIKTILKDADGLKCDALNVKESGRIVAVKMKCSDPKEQSRMEIDTTVNFLGTRHYTGMMKSVVIFGGQKLASEMTIDAQWITAACKK